jgi:hypothetical protein
MIKKAVFADELMHGMQRELHSHDMKQGMQNLGKAVDCLQAAAEIFEEFGMYARSDQVLKVLTKIAHKDPDDVIEFTSLKPSVIEEPGEVFEFTSLKDPQHFKPINPGDVIEFNRLPSEKSEVEVNPDEEISFQSLLADDQDAKGKPNKPKDPTKVNDHHTNGLTSKKMEENLKNHGHPMNLAEDHVVAANLNQWLLIARAELTQDNDEVNDLLDVDIEEEDTPSFDNLQDQTFEDSD